MSELLQAHPLRKLFPDIAQLRIELVFDDAGSSAVPPSPQLRTLYAAAPAFFRFACPCADCDGAFDLTEAVGQLNGGAGRSRTVALASTGQLSCNGMRFRDRPLLQRDCPMRLTFRLRIERRGHG